MEKIKLVITDKEMLFRNGLSLILSGTGEFDVAFEASNDVELFNKLQEATNLPEIILLDSLTEENSVIKIIKGIKKLYSDMKIILMSADYNDAFILKMIETGVNAYIPKNIELDKLKHAIKEVSKHGMYFPHTLSDIMKIRNAVNRKQYIEKLTTRETDILKLICNEYTNGEIADKLFLSIRTIEGHRNNLLSKTGAKNTAGLVVYALLNNLVDFSKKIKDLNMMK